MDVCELGLPLAKMADLHASREDGGTVKVSLKRGSSTCVDIVKGFLGRQSNLKRLDRGFEVLKLFAVAWRLYSR